jgi:hypothetical protein
MFCFQDGCFVEVRKRLVMVVLLMNGALLNLVAKLTTLVLMQRMEKGDTLESLKDPNALRL